MALSQKGRASLVASKMGENNPMFGTISPTRKVSISRDDLERMFVAEGHAIRWIAKELAVSSRTVQNWLKCYGIFLSPEQLSSRKSHGGELAWNYQGGKITHQGYIYSHSLTHPCRNRDNYIMQHRLVVEEFINRLLYEGEQIHHLNWDKSDNRIVNLALFHSASEHTAFHKWMEKVGAYTLGLISSPPNPIAYDEPVLVSGEWIREINLSFWDKAAKAA